MSRSVYIVKKIGKSKIPKGFSKRPITEEEYAFQCGRAKALEQKGLLKLVSGTCWECDKDNGWKVLIDNLNILFTCDKCKRKYFEGVSV